MDYIFVQFFGLTLGLGLDVCTLDYISLVNGSLLMQFDILRKIHDFILITVTNRCKMGTIKRNQV